MRRNFNKIVGAALALIGLGTAAQTTAPAQQSKDIVAIASRPSAGKMEDRKKPKHGAGQRSGHRYKCLYDNQRKKRKHLRSNPNSNKHGLKIK